MPATGYTQVTLAQLVTSLQARLHDPSGLFWTASEVQSYVLEALQTWQAMSQYYTERASIPTVPNSIFYDLFALIPDLTPTVTDQALIVQIEQQLQEPISATSWIGTEQFTYAGVVDAIQKALDRFLLETGMVQKWVELPGPTPQSGAWEFPDNVASVVRIMWKDLLSGIYSLVWPADPFSLAAGNPQWYQTPATPTDYSIALNKPLILQLAPPPLAAGSVNMVYIPTGPTLNPSAGATILGVPDDFAWVVKFGALATLFNQEGPGLDRERGKYCQMRFEDGLKLARMYNFVRFGYQTGIPAFVGSIHEMDTFEPSWVSALPGTIQNIGASGNIIATSPIADNSPQSLAFDIIPKAPLPSLTQYIQVGKEFLDAIMDYAQHIAQLKIGGTEFQETAGLYQSLLKLAATENDMLRANAQNFDVLSDRSQRQFKSRPRRESDLKTKELDYESA